jgi:enediyne biosynthesis protein E4
MVGIRNRRQRLLLRAIALSAVLGILLIGAVLLRPAPEQYVPGEKMAGLTDDLGRALPPDYPRVEFVDASLQAGIDFQHFHGIRSVQLPEDMGSGAAWGDYDNDGNLDLYAVNIAGPLTTPPERLAVSPAHNALYHNRGDGNFDEVAQQAGVNFRGTGQAAAWGDYDNDGNLDLATTSYGENILYHNRGNGTFENVSDATGISDATGFWSGASWGDYDRDGDLDLYICGYVQYRQNPAHQTAQTRQYNILIPASLNPSTYKPERNLLYRNAGDGSFAEVAANAGVANPTGRSLSATWSDLDDDGWLDLYVANDLSDNVLYHNTGDGTFTDISHQAWVADYRGAMGLAVGDWDEDGDQDLFVSHWIAQENAFYSNMRADYREAELAPGQIGLRFMDVADQMGLGQIALDYIGWGTAFLDYDGDGRQDLIVANGSTFQQEDDPTRLIPMRPLLFWNRDEREGFFEVGQVGGEPFTRSFVGRGLAVGDYDGDGDPDAFILANGGKGILLRNDRANRHSWLKLHLRGTTTNSHGLGARVRAVANGRSYHREVGAGSSYLSQHAAGELLFGLGDATRIDSLKITWLGGPTQILTDLPVNRTLRIEEGTQWAGADSR